MHRNSPWKTLVALVATVLIAAAAPAFATCIKNNHIGPADQLTDEVEGMFEARKFAKLDALARDYERGFKPTSDGQSALMAYYRGIAGEFTNCSQRRLPEEAWTAHEQAIRDWIRASKDPVPAKLALALFTMDYGWHGRGGGYASTVGDDAWAVFRDRVASSKRQLDELAPKASGNPAWQAGMLNIALAQGWKPAAFEAVRKKAVQLDPYYLTTHYISASYYSPRWHGTTEQLKKSIAESARLTKGRLGDTMYTRLSWTTLESEDMFKNGDVEWPRMKAGFEDWLRLSPDENRRNHYARLACMAGDSHTVKLQLAKLEGHMQPREWPSEHFYLYCKALAEADGTGKQPYCYQRKDNQQIVCEVPR